MRWLCLDPGAKRTGVAISSPEGGFAMPLLVLEHEVSGPPLDEVTRLMREHSAGGLVIGLPLSMDGSFSAQTLAALSLARQLAAHFGSSVEVPCGITLPEAVDEPVRSSEDRTGGMGIRVVLCDERLSSWQARRATADDAPSGRKRSSSERRLDAHAAAVILQSFLDGQESPASHSDELE